MIITRTVRRITDKITEAERIVTDDFKEGAIETEPSLTDRFLGAVKMSFGENGFRAEGYQINVRTLGDRGRNAPEHEFGADFVCILDINIPNYNLSKGFLAQAKIAVKKKLKL